VRCRSAIIHCSGFVGLLGILACGPDEPPRFATVQLELRPDSPNSRETFRFEADEHVETFDSDRVRVHFTREGRNAVPLGDDDEDEIPDYVELVAKRYDSYIDRYVELGYRAPLGDADLRDDNGGDGRFDVYLIDFFSSSDGAFQTDLCSSTCVGYVVQENDFAGFAYGSLDRATRILATHELFHAVQASYDAGQDGIFSEGTAVWATEQLEPDLDDFEGFVGGYLEAPHRPLNRPARGVVVNPFNYGAALFFRFLTERFDDDDLVRRLLERVEDGASGVEDPVWYEALDALLRTDFQISLSDVYAEFALWNAFTGSRSKSAPGIGYAEAERYPPVAARNASLPYTDEAPRHAQMSTRYYAFSTGRRERLEARLVGDADGMKLWLLVESASGFHVSDGSTTATARVDTQSPAILAVVNSSLEGPSRRASVCIGSPSEVEACSRELAPDDERPSDADPPPRDDPPGPEDPPPEDPAPTRAASDCRSGPDGGTALLLALIAFAMLRGLRGCGDPSRPGPPSRVPSPLRPIN